MRVHEKSASWVSPKWVKSNKRRKKEEEEERAKVSVNNGQVNAWTKNLLLERCLNICLLMTQVVGNPWCRHYASVFIAL